MKNQLSLLEAIKGLEDSLKYVIRTYEKVGVDTYHLYYDYVAGVLYISNKQKSDRSLCLYSYQYKSIGYSKEIYQNMLEHVEKYFSELKFGAYNDKIKVLVEVSEEYLELNVKAFISSLTDWNEVVENFLNENTRYELNEYLGYWESELPSFSNYTDLEKKMFLKGASYSKLLDIQTLPLSIAMNDYPILTSDSLPDMVLVRDFDDVL